MTTPFLEWFPVVEPVKNTHPPPPKIHSIILLAPSKWQFFPKYPYTRFGLSILAVCHFTKTENLFCRANRRHHKQISHLASKASLSGLFCNFSRYVKLCGGGDQPLQSITEKSIWISCSKRLQKPGWRLNP